VIFYTFETAKQLQARKW